MSEGELLQAKSGMGVYAGVVVCNVVIDVSRRCRSRRWGHAFAKVVTVRPFFGSGMHHIFVRLGGEVLG